MSTVMALVVIVLFVAAAVITTAAAYTGQPYRLDAELEHMHRADQP